MPPVVQHVVFVVVLPVVATVPQPVVAIAVDATVLPVLEPAALEEVAME